MNEDLLSSKTMRLWIMLVGVAFVTMVLAGAVTIAFGIEIPYVQEFFAFLGIGGGAGTFRNVVSDGPARRNGYGQAPPGQPPTPPSVGGS